MNQEIYVKGYGFSSFAKNMGTHATKTVKNLSKKYGQKLLDSAKKSTTDAIKTASKRAIQKTAEATGDLIDRITSVSKKKPAKEFHNNDQTKEDVEIATPKKRYISPEEKKNIDELRLVPKKDAYF